MVSGEDLRWLVDENVSVLPVVSDVVLNLVEVNVWGPAVDIDDGQEKVFSRHHDLLELFLQVFCAPGHVRRLAFLLILSHFVQSEAHMSEFVSETFDDSCCFLGGSLFMLLHRQV